MTTLNQAALAAAHKEAEALYNVDTPMMEIVEKAIGAYLSAATSANADAQTEARAIALDTWLKSFTVYSVEDDESSIRLSINGQRIACWGDTSPQGIALLQFDAGHREAATDLAAKDAEREGWRKTATEYASEIHELRAQLAEAGKALDALGAFAFWFQKYPEFKPNPDMQAEMLADLDRARPFIPARRALNAGGGDNV